jgi:hypothetical protein
MKVTGAVKPDEVPRAIGTAFGVWTSLATRVIEAHERGEVLTVVCDNRDEYRKMTNGMSERLRMAGYRRRFVAIDEANGNVRVYLQLEERPSTITVAPPVLGRPKRKQA